MALHLATKGDHRSLIVLVEKWAQVGDPSPGARLGAARAFVELRMLDRAWVRLKDLVEAPTPDVEALAIAAEMFLLRGWPNKAKKAVQRGLQLAPDHAILRSLVERTQDGPTEPDEDAVESDQTPIADLIRVAEQFMSHGSFVRARTLLERVKKRVPEHRWAADLLWAMDGDFAGGDQTLADLCDRLGPDLALIGDIPEEPEHTESAHLDDLPSLPIEREDDGPFPTLFRNLEPQTEAYTKARAAVEARSDPELTAVRSLASVSTLATGDPAEQTDPHADDTQIVRVVTKGEAGGQVDTAVDRTFNLADYRRQMGVDPTGVDRGPEVARDYTAGPEDEDDSVVVLTRREDSTDTRDPTTDVGQGIAEDARSEAAAKERRGGVEDAGWAARESTPAPAVPRQEAEPQRARTPVPAARATSPRSRASIPPVTRRQGPSAATFAWPWWVAVLAGLMLAGAVACLVIAIAVALQ